MIFIFENFWLFHEDFMQVMEFGWGIPNNEQDKAKRVGAKFKALRKVLRQWQSQILNLGKTIENSKTIISFLDILEKSHDLSLEEWNFRVLLQEHLWNNNVYIGNKEAGSSGPPLVTKAPIFSMPQP
jgi:hypothetical protein